MDSFIDKFAQRRNAQNMIKANSMAEAEEKERMASKIAGYEEILQNMQKCNLQNLENAEKVRELLAASLQKIEEVQKEDAAGEKAEGKLLEEMKKLLEELEERQKESSELQKAQLEEFLNAQRTLTGEQKTQFEQLMADQKAQLEELTADQKAQFEEQAAKLQGVLDAQKESLEEMKESIQDFTHKEAVKAYRNVQAVVEEAAAKQTKEITDAVKGIKSSAGPMVVGILTLIAVLADIGFAVAQFLGLL